MTSLVGRMQSQILVNFGYGGRTMILADKIIEERKKNGWTQEDLAQKLGVSRQSVSKWESEQSTPDIEKIIIMSELFEVTTDYILSTDYLLKDEIEKENTDISCDTDCVLHRVSMEEANAYMDEKKKAAPMLANATTLCILSPVSLFLVSTLNDGLAIGIACTALIVTVALAVFIFVKTGIKLSTLQYLEQEPFETEYGVTGFVKEKNQSYQEHYSFSLACGVVLCILSVIPLIIAGCMEVSDYICTLCLAVLFILVSVGVNILIRVSTIKSSYDTLLQEGDFTKKEKLAKKKTETFTGAYWCLVTAVYLGWSLWTKQWDVTYMIWPVAAVLYAAMYGIVRMIMKLEK